MLEFLRDSGKTSERKLRLFAVACCRLVAKLLPPDPCRVAVEMSERFADGRASHADLEGSRTDVNDVPPARRTRLGDGNSHAFSAALHVASADFHDIGPAMRVAEDTANLGIEDVLHGEDAHAWFRRWAATRTIDVASNPEALNEAVREYRTLALAQWCPQQGHLLRDIIGNPFRAAPAIDPLWLARDNGLVTSLAQAAYKERALPSGHLDVAQLAVLADALTDAGCAEPDLLGHLRGPGPHVRGCFVLDLLLSKE
jgi:hypothetical protein